VPPPDAPERAASGLAQGSAREREKHDPARIDPLRHKPGHPRRKSFGLARAGPRNGKNRALACGGSAKLFGVQIVNPGFGHVPSRIRTTRPDVQPLRGRLK
jgi:hypothetical protein